MASKNPVESQKSGEQEPQCLMDPQVLEVWKKSINEMNFNHLVQLEWKPEGKSPWKKMFHKVAWEALKCLLCETAPMMKMPCIKQHLAGKKHLRKFEKVVLQLRHPNQDPVKKLNLNKGLANKASGIVSKPATTVGKAPAPTTPKPSGVARAKPSAVTTANSQPTTPKITVASFATSTPVKASAEISEKSPELTPAKSVTSVKTSTVAPSKTPTTAPIKTAVATVSKTATNATTKAGVKTPLTSTPKAIGVAPKKPVTGTLTKAPAVAASKPAQSSVFKIPTSTIPKVSAGPSSSPGTPAKGVTTKTVPKVVQKTTPPAVMVAAEPMECDEVDIKPSEADLNKVASSDNSAKNDCSNMNLTKFRESIPNLDNMDILKIEYKYVNTDWEFLFKKEHNYYICCMCKNSTFPLVGMKSHMKNPQHQTNIGLVRGLHHPTLYATKKAAETKNQTSVPRESSNNTNLVINPASVQKQTVETTSSTALSLKDILPNLEVDELLKIEFRFPGPNCEWKFMFKQFPDTSFKCLLCEKFFIKNLQDLREHMQTVRHKSSIDLTERLYHPILAPTKTDKELSSGTGNAPLKPITLNLKGSEVKQTTRSTPQHLMNQQEFMKHLTKLDMQQLRKVEFLQKNVWKMMISTKLNIITCNLCEVTGIGSHKTFLDHLSGKRHAESTSRVQKFYHPSYTTSKTDPERIEHNVSEPVKSSVPMPVTITVEDSPEREIPNKVINPVAVLAKSSENNQTNALQKRNDQVSMQQNVKSPIPPRKQIDQTPSATRNVVQELPSFRPERPAAPRYNQQGERIIIPRVRTSINSPPNETSFVTKDYMTTTKIAEVEGFIGVEYVVKILRSVNDSSPRFECCLCEVEVDAVRMQVHLKELYHRKKYLERHFSTAMRPFTKYKDDPKYIQAMRYICEQLAIAIEKYHGRDLPFECLQEEFRSNRDGIMSKVFSFRHASEFTGPSFTNIIDNVTLEDIIANQDKYDKPIPKQQNQATFVADSHQQMNQNIAPFGNQPASRPVPSYGFNQNQYQNSYQNTASFNYGNNRQQNRDGPPLDVEQHRVLVEQFLQNTNNNPSQKSMPRRHRSRSRSPRHRSSRSKDRSHRSRSSRQSKNDHPCTQFQLYSEIRQSPVRNSSGDIWDNYRRMFDHAVEDLDRDYQEFRRDPEKHPQYDDEWKKYWTRKSKRLREERIDPSTFDFQPGWVRYFARRVHQLYEESVENLRLKLRGRLNLPLHNNNLRDIRYHVGAHRIEDPVSDEDVDMPDQGMPNVHSQAIHDQVTSVQPRIVEKEPQPYQHENTHFNSTTSATPTVLGKRPISESVYVNPNPGGPPEDRFNRPIPMEDSSMIPNKRPVMDRPTEEKNNDQQFGSIPEAVTVVSVLRLLTALEDQLGSLGPKVIDLLSKALTLEKVKPNSADDALFTAENCVFLETVNEKLKGQILAGVIEGCKLKAVRRVMNDLTNLLKKANENLSANPPPPPLQSMPKDFSRTFRQVPPKRPAPPVGTGPPAKAPCVDKQELATKLAAALAAQGKTDYKQDQLEQLVTLYALIEKKKHESNPNKPDDPPGQQKKSLSDTLLDYLKPGGSLNSTPNSQTSAPRQFNQVVHRLPIRQVENRNFQSTSNFQASGSNIYNRMSGDSYLSSSNPEPPSVQSRANALPSYNFGQLSNFDTSLNISSFSRIPYMNKNSPSTAAGGIWQNPSNQGQNLQNNTTMSNSSFNQQSVYGNYPGVQQQQQQQRLPEINRHFNQNQNPNQNISRELQRSQQDNSNPVLTSTSMSRGRNNTLGGGNNSGMVAYPSIWRNQGCNNPQDLLGERSRPKAPMGWQRNNQNRR